MVLGIGTGPCPQLVDAQSLRFSSCAQQAGTQPVSFSSNFWNFLKQRTNLKTAQDYSSQLLTKQFQARGPENLSQRKIAFPAFPGAAMQLTAFPGSADLSASHANTTWDRDTEGTGWKLGHTAEKGQCQLIFFPNTTPSCLTLQVSGTGPRTQKF